jgi:hypothetical protein
MAALSSIPSREDLTAPAGSVAFIDVPARRFLAVDGRGDPDRDPDFKRAVRLLYAAAYTLKFALKRRRAVATQVGPLEGLWTTDSRGAFDAASKQHFIWTLLLAVPEEASDDDVRAAIDASVRRDPALAGSIRMESIDEGRAAQTMHIGPYCTESATIQRLHDAIIQAGLMPGGRHHEIYLGDPRLAAPGRLKTILRQPVRDTS